MPVRLVAGSAWGRTSPVKVFSDTLYADVALAAGEPARFDTVPGDAEEFIPLPEKEKIVRYP